MGIVIDYSSGFFEASPAGENVGTISSGTLDLSTGNVFSDAPMALSDVTMPDTMIAYRQALRDIPSQAGFPFSVNWPTKPE